MKKLLIIDGHSLIYRAFHGVPPLNTKEGIPTNALTGFLKMVLSLRESEAPSHFAVAFDESGKVFRHAAFADYKAHRKPMDEDLRPQIPLIKEALSAMNVPVLSLKGYEGDDIIGTVTALAEKEGFESVIVSGDRDNFQLVSEKTSILFPKKGLKNIERVNLSYLWEAYDLLPHEVVEMKALMGDKSDNIPGVSGIGEVYARRFIRTYGNLENLYNHLDDFEGKKQGLLLKKDKEMAFLSKSLATIKRDVPLVFELEDLRLQAFDKERLLAFYTLYELNQLKKGLMTEGEVIERSFNFEEIVLEGFAQLEKIFEEEAREKLFFALDDKTEKISFAFTFDGIRVYRYQLYEDKAQVLSLFKRWQKEKNGSFYLEDSKRFYHFVKNAFVAKVAWDFLLSDYLLHAEEGKHELTSALARECDLISENLSLTQKAYGLSILYDSYDKKLEQEGLKELYFKMELPLSKVLYEMEAVGISIDKAYLESLREEFSSRLKALEEEIYKISGHTFNLNSPKQLGEVLFEKMGLPVIKKTKTGYSTNVEVLEALYDQSPIIALILDYRQLSKLNSTYVEGLLSLASSKNRVHTTFNQAITTTGRLSSTEPNLQNIPIRTNEGKRIRKAFVPLEAEHVLVSADYSQIELRLLAHMSGDENLVTSFKNGEDIHRRTASEVFHLPLEEVTQEMRRAAKAVNFGIIYGQTDFGLSKELGITRNEAKKYIESYFSHYQKVNDFITKAITEAREKGYAKTLFDRKREIREISSKNFVKRSFAERTAVNTPLQGTAADIIKLAMLKCQDLLLEEGLEAKMLLQVHDELVFDVPPKELGILVGKIKKVMTEVTTLDVPLEVDIKVGFNWDEMEVVD